MRYRVDGVQFRLIALDQELAAADISVPARLRNRVAYRCFGASELAGVMANPFGLAPANLGLIDGLRPSRLTDCDVPLAVIHWTASGVKFIDLWAVRRSVVAPAAQGSWTPFVGSRRQVESTAMLLQFQAHLADIQRESGVAPALAAAQRFAFLPPAGLLPTGGGAFTWQTFLGDHAPAAATVVDVGLLRSILLNALTADPFAVGQAPLVAVDVFRSPAAPGFVLFARSPHGRLRVTLQPPPVGGAPVQVLGTGYAGTRIQNGVGPQAAYMLSGLAAGSYKVRVRATGYHRRRVNDVAVIGGQITDLTIPMQPLQASSIALQVRDAQTGQMLGLPGSVQPSVRIASLDLSAAADANGRFIFDQLVAGAYAISVSAAGYQSQVVTVNVAAGQQVQSQVDLAKVAVAKKTPVLCIKTTAVRRRLERDRGRDPGLHGPGQDSARRKRDGQF